MVLLLAALAVGTACSGEDGAGNDGAAPAEDLATTIADDGQVAAGEADEAGDVEGGAAGGAVDDPQAGRSIVSTAQLVVGVDDIDEAAAEARAVVEDADGVVSDERTTRTGEASTELTARVPPDAFDATLVALADLGELASQTVETDDVTEQVVDLEARIETAEASVVRLRDLVAQAEDVGDVAALEAELLARETTLEQLRGQLRTVEDQVALATITATFTSEEEVAGAEDEVDLPSFLDGLEGGVEALLTAGSIVLVVLGFLLPFVPLLVVVALVARWAVRRDRRRREAARRRAAGEEVAGRGPAEQVPAEPDQPQ